MSQNQRVIVVAGGCFWGVEEYYRRLKGVISAESGYAQGTLENPTYEAVCGGDTGHAEAVRITYNPEEISYEMILDHLFRMIDPTQTDGQANDLGDQYRTGIYPESDEEIAIAKKEIERRQADYDAPIATEVEALRTFWRAEPFHQMYLVNNPRGYCHIDFSLIQPHELKG